MSSSCIFTIIWNMNSIGNMSLIQTEEIHRYENLKRLHCLPLHKKSFLRLQTKRKRESRSLEWFPRAPIIIQFNFFLHQIVKENRWIYHTITIIINIIILLQSLLIHQVPKDTVSISSKYCDLQVFKENWCKFCEYTIERF